MPRHKITPKPERERFKREVVKLLAELGAIAINEAEYRMNTKAGPLSIDVDLGNDSHSPCSVFTRFDYALTAQALVGASVPSGKYNFHFSSGTTCNAALDEIRSCLSRIKPTTLEQFRDETSIMPGVVAKTVLEERGILPQGASQQSYRMEDPAWNFHNETYKDFAAGVQWFIAHCEQRIVQLWDINPLFHKKLAGKSGLDITYAFVAHWLEAYLDNPPQYRKRHPNWDAPSNLEPMAA